MPVPAPIDLHRWIEKHRDRLRPPVGNAQVWPEDDFIVMVVGGPNARKDFHIDPGAELFFQVEGDIIVRVVEDGEQRDVPIREGELFLLPPNVPHSPRRPADTVGLVVERHRGDGELDALRWYCDHCGAVLHETSFQLRDITVQIREAIETWRADESLRTCGACGKLTEPDAR